MNSHSKSTFSAPVVQSRLEHHHQQQLKQPEGRQHLPHHQRSKSLNKGKRGFSHNNYHQKSKETTNFTTSPTTISSAEFTRKNFSNHDSSSYLKNNDLGLNNNNNNLIENGSVGQLQRKISAPSRPPRRHQHSDSVDEDKFRVTPVISILKRPQSATDFVKSSNSKSTLPLDVTQEEQGFHRSNNNNNNNKIGERSPPPQHRRSQSKERRRSDVTHSRTKRAQRKEVKSMEFETDLTFGANPGSGDESDVNSNNKFVKSVPSLQSNTAVIFPPLNYDNAIIALEEGMNSNRREDTYSNSDDNATIKSSYKKYIESTPRRRSSTAIELQSQLSHFTDSVPLPSESFLSSTPPSARRPSSSPSRLGSGPKLYAGPTFHNSPAPSDLPMPSFYGKSLGKEPSPLSIGGNNLFTVPENTPSHDAYSSPSSGNTSDDDMFAMDDFEQPPKAPYYSGTPSLRKQKSQELLRILSAANARQHQPASAYMVPERMATAHHPMQVYPANGLNLNEISETLRSLLKIHGQ